MGCPHCHHSQAFRRKLGRCRRCILQLILLSTLSWCAWFYYYLPTPTQVESITLLFAASAFSLLLLAHGVAALARIRNPHPSPSR
ncbi:DUF3624 domain-containing protein [Photobacterium sp. MCCC 1A19761]|uniref:DUF3624 domain-containing protein n=1 Tax=Photobacterium sp. MCCC 1A19761 TaxID=3115000 RepID=UPI00307F9048